MGEGAEFQIFAGLILEDFAAELALVSLRMV